MIWLSLLFYTVKQQDAASSQSNDGARFKQILYLTLTADSNAVYKSRKSGLVWLHLRRISEYLGGLATLTVYLLTSLS